MKIELSQDEMLEAMQLYIRSKYDFETFEKVRLLYCHKNGEGHFTVETELMGVHKKQPETASRRGSGHAYCYGPYRCPECKKETSG